MKIIEKLKTQKEFKNSFLTLSGNLISQGMSFLVTILLSRSMTVADYGLYSVLNSISTFVTDMADLGMNGAITRFVAEYHGRNEADKEEQIINYAIRRKVRSLIVVFIVLVLLAKPIAQYFLHDSSLYHYVYYIVLTCMFSLFVGAMRAVIQGRQEYGKFFVSVVSWNLVWMIVIVTMFVTNRMTIAASIMAGAISGAVNLIICSVLLKIKPIQWVKKIEIDPIIKEKLKQFGNWMVLWTIFALLQARVDVFMLATLTTAEQVSYYDIASKLIKPVLMVTSSYAQVLNPLFASMSHGSQLNKKIKEVCKFIVFVCSIIVLAIILVGPLVKLVFGNKYDNAILPAQLLLFAIIFYVWTIPFNSALYAINKPQVFTFAAFVGLIVTIIGNYFLLAKLGAVGAAYTYILAQVVGLVVSVIAYYHFFKRKEKNDGE